MQLLDGARLAKNIEAAARYDLEQNKVFGCAYRVTQAGKTVYQKGFGSTRPGGGEPVTARTLFRLASMTKPVTAFAALLLADRGLLSLDDPIGKYLPAFRDMAITRADGKGGLIAAGRAKNPVTIRHLLSHTNGIGTDPMKEALLTPGDRVTLSAALDFYARTGLDFEPGTQQQYSGTAAFDVMAAIIELITGEDYAAFLQREIFAPCGMGNTGFVPTPAQWESLIPMHIREEGENRIAPMEAGCVFGEFPCTHYLGGAGLFSTLADYGKFAQMLLEEGQSESGPLLSKQTFALMKTPAVTRSIMPGTERWGLGVRVITDAAYPHLPAGTFGWSGAYGTHFWVDPQNRITAVYMKNSLTDGGAAHESARNFEQAVHDAFSQA